MDAHLAWAMSEQDALGVRLRGVLSDKPLLQRSADLFQLGVEPYAEVHFGEAWLGMGFVLNLDQPVGVYGDRAGQWKARLQLGMEIP
jgi:hypothetical protein